VPFNGAWRWPLFRHTLINAFSAGALKRYVPEAELEIGGGTVSPRRPSGRFHFKGLGAQLKALRKPPVDPSVLPWLRDIRERRSTRLWQPYQAKLVYFGLPSTTVDQLQYVRGFCQAIGSTCISPADQALLSQLDDAKLWRDASHLTKAGADIYSRWLAHQLVALGLLRR